MKLIAIKVVGSTYFVPNQGHVCTWKTKELSTRAKLTYQHAVYGSKIAEWKDRGISCTVRCATLVYTYFLGHGTVQIC